MYRNVCTVIWEDLMHNFEICGLRNIMPILFTQPSAPRIILWLCLAPFSSLNSAEKIDLYHKIYDQNNYK